MLVLRNLTAGVDVPSAVKRPRSPLGRAVGWLGAARIEPRAGKWLQPAAAIHTVGMRSAIDVIFLDRAGRIVALHPRVPPNRWWLGHRRAASVLEMGPGFLERASLRVGDRLDFIDAHDDGTKMARQV